MVYSTLQGTVRMILWHRFALDAPSTQSCLHQWASQPTQSLRDVDIFIWTS